MRRAVAGALRRAGEPAAALARACAILGDRLPVRRAALLAGLDPGAADLAADRLAAAGLLAAARPLRFVLGAVRALVAPGERAELHRRAATALVAEDDMRRAAAHLLEVPARDDAQVVATLVASADEAVAEGALATAERLRCSSPRRRRSGRWSWRSSVARACSPAYRRSTCCSRRRPRCRWGPGRT
ncbi:MAG TPA: hypothetical protein VD931_07085 [Baekduia sp.]|nr:hypothetical protein [Baekduia sp.]